MLLLFFFSPSLTLDMADCKEAGTMNVKIFIVGNKWEINRRTQRNRVRDTSSFAVVVVVVDLLLLPLLLV